jgi:isocitrate dehydrogenase kinase/phosphatase
MQIDPFYSPCTKFKTMWIKDMQIKLDTLKLIEEKVGKRLKHGHRRKIPEQNSNSLCCKIKQESTYGTSKIFQSFCKAKNTVNKAKRQPTDWENIFTSPKSNRGLISKIYKELKKVDSQRTK